MSGHFCIANPCPLCAPPHTGGAPSQLDAAALREAGRVAGIAEALSACARQYDGFAGGEKHPINQGVILCMKAIRALQPTTPDPTPSSGGGAMEWEAANRPPSDRKTWTSVFWPTMPSDFPQGYLIAPFPSGHQVYVDRLCPEGWEMRCLKLGCPDVITGKVTDVWDTDRLLKALADGRVIMLGTTLEPGAQTNTTAQRWRDEIRAAAAAAPAAPRVVAKPDPHAPYICMGCAHVFEKCPDLDAYNCPLCGEKVRPKKRSLGVAPQVVDRDGVRAEAFEETEGRLRAACLIEEEGDQECRWCGVDILNGHQSDCAVSVMATLLDTANAIRALKAPPPPAAAPLDALAAIRAMPHEQAIGVIMSGASDEQWKRLAGMAATLMVDPERFVWDSSCAKSTTTTAPPATAPPETHRWVGSGDYGSTENGVMCGDCGVDGGDDESSRPCGTPSAPPAAAPPDDVIRGLLDEADGLEENAKQLRAMLPDMEPEARARELAAVYIRAHVAIGSAPPPTGERTAGEPGASFLLALKPKPRTTVARFASELKARIARVEAAFGKPGQEQFVAGAAYIKGVVDALLSDYDTRDPEDYMRSSRSPAGTETGGKRDGR